jgi:hypothetical protein
MVFADSIPVRGFQNRLQAFQKTVCRSELLYASQCERFMRRLPLGRFEAYFDDIKTLPIVLLANSRTR